MTSRRGTARTASAALAARTGWGALLLVAPGRVLRLTGHVDAGRGPRRLLRVLGARHLAQAALECRGGVRTRNVGTGVDATHALSDVVFACLDSRWRRAAALDALVTGGFVVLGLTNA